MQKGFTDELQRLRPGRCQFCGERRFAAQTPTRAAAVAEGQYTCDRCKRDKNPVKSFPSANDMDSESVPDQLKGLTEAEEMLITKGCPVMRVYRLKGGQRGYGGHVVNLAQNIDDFVNSLLWPARDLPIIVVRRQGGEGTRKDFLVRRQRVFDAQTMDKAVVDLGKLESTAGLTFVCLAKRLVDLLIEPMPLERLSEIGDTPIYQLRLREEVRLHSSFGFAKKCALELSLGRRYTSTGV